VGSPISPRTGCHTASLLKRGAEPGARGAHFEAEQGGGAIGAPETLGAGDAQFQAGAMGTLGKIGTLRKRGHFIARAVEHELERARAPAAIAASAGARADEDHPEMVD
jgi:hypothetical protein